MGVCAAAGKTIEVERLLAEAEADVSELVDIVSYNIVVKAYTLHRDYPNAVKVLARMRARGLEPNSITYNSLIDAAARTGEAAAAWEFYQDMAARGFQGDKYTCSILIKTLSPNPTGDRIRRCLDLLRVAFKGTNTPAQSSSRPCRRIQRGIASVGVWIYCAWLSRGQIHLLNPHQDPVAESNGGSHP